MRLRTVGIALAATVAIGLASAAPASAQHWRGHGGWHGGWGGFGPGFVGGLALGAVAAPGYYGYGYGPYAHGYDGYYDGGPACYVRRHVVINRFGERIVRRVRVCE